MYLLLQCILLILGFAMLVKGADWFVEGSAGIADRFGIPQLVIGLTIVAMGTSAPEAAVSITAALKGSAAITIGNVAVSYTHLDVYKRQVPTPVAEVVPERV